MTAPQPVVLAEVVRSGFVECVHHGHAVIVDADGAVVRAWGDPDVEIFPRSSNKPAQAVGMLRAGLDLPPDLLALAQASHSGEPMHLDAVRRILAGAGLDESALQTPDDYPLDDVERDAWIARGAVPCAIAMNCSGKHAAMLATCIANDWDIEDYRDPAHPLQQAVTASVSELAGEPIAHVGVDGCGAPLLSLTLTGLARSLGRIAQADPTGDGRVGSAMRAHPELVGGSRRPVTEFMRAVPGLLSKDGAEGVWVLALPDGRAAAVKVLDGADRARTVAVAQLLTELGHGDGVNSLRTLPVLGGGRTVGEIRSALA